MTRITQLLLECDDPEPAARFYAEALGLGDRIRTRGTDEPSTGFRGATVSLIVPDPGVVDGLLASGIAAGARTEKPAKRNLFGYGGTLQSPDGTVVTVATSSKKPTGAVPGTIDELVLQLGVTAVVESKEFYVAHGTEVAHSYGRKYASFATGDISLALLTRSGLAKAAGVDPEGSGSHRLAIVGDLGELTDPDGFRWEDPGHDD